jgi:hypothetical protein
MTTAVARHTEMVTILANLAIAKSSLAKTSIKDWLS